MEMRRTVENPKQLGALYAELANVQQPFTIAVKQGKQRSNRYNRTLHMWFKEIAQQRRDVTEAEVKAECNLTYGRPILDRDDEEWSSAFGYIFDSLNHASKLKAIRVLDIPFTRKMTTKQLNEYTEQMLRDYRDAGFRLTDPEMQGIEEMMR